MKRWLIILFVVFLLVAGSVLGAVRWLTHSQAGAQWLVGMIGEVDGIELRYQSLSGTLSDGLKWRALEVGAAGYQAELDKLDLRISWTLFPQSLSIDLLDARDVTVHLAESTEEPARDSELFPVFQSPECLSSAP